MRRNVKGHFFAKQSALASHSRLGQVASSSHQLTEWLDCTFLSRNDPAILTLQLLACFTGVLDSNESLLVSRSQVPVARNLFIAHT